jgi:outer membrane PBP1 activator LpoA protein
LLLPTAWQPFAQAAEAVRAGFVDASTKQSATTLAIRLYPVTDDSQNVIASYRQAAAAGAQIVVGPLTRSGVSALAATRDAITVTTLALNVPERAPTAAKLYMLGLQLETEARQVAQLALSEGRRKAFTVSEPTPLSRRIREAFISEFEQGGGHHIAEYGYTTEPESLERMKQAAALGVADMVFFAVEAARVTNMRSYMPSVTAYGTSQVNPSAAPESRRLEMSNMRFVDMPWMVQPEHPAVALYARPGVRESDDLERLYALGIDAFRVAEKLLEGKEEIDVDGVTGRLTLTPDHQFRRGLLVTLVEGGKLVVLGEAKP